jgi:hypothetical protein
MGHPDVHAFVMSRAAKPLGQDSEEVMFTIEEEVLFSHPEMKTWPAAPGDVVLICRWRENPNGESRDAALWKFWRWGKK